MKAIRLRQPAGIDNLHLEELAVGDPGPGEIKVRVRASSLNFRDGLVVGGFFPVHDGLIPLSDAAGEVIEVGAGVTEFAPGDRVVSTFHPNWIDGHIERAQLNNSPGGPADGFACEVAVRPATHFTRAPAGLDFAQCATLTCAGVTAWRALVTDGKVKPGATVLVQGTGGVSIYALQIAKAAGATVIALSSSGEKLERLRSLGADHLVNYREVPEWGQPVLDLTGGLGVDHIVEVAGPRSIAQSFVAARTGGHVAIIGAVGGFDIDTMPFAIVQAKRLRLQAVTVGSRRDQMDLVTAIETNGISPVVDQTFSLSETPNAFRQLAQGKHFGKLCIDMDDAR